jgi:spore coat polysaccharide biosynthesis protein SpsF
VKIGAIILSRLDSSRLPNKALINVAGKPLISYVSEICLQVSSIDQVVIATSDRSCDDPLETYAQNAGFSCFRGSVDDVAGRFLGAMERYDFDGALRVNGDSPLNDPDLLSRGARIFRENKYDLVSNVPGRTYPYGMSLEIVSIAAMRETCEKMSLPQHLEHVTKFFYDNIRDFSVHLIRSGKPEYSGVQLAVDTEDDLLRFQWIVKNLKTAYSNVSGDEFVRLAREYMNK